VQYRANGRFAGIDLPHFRGGIYIFPGGFPPPKKYGLNKTLHHHTIVAKRLDG